MAIITNGNQLPAGWIRRAFPQLPKVSIVGLIDRALPFSKNTENDKIFALLPAGQQNRRYVVCVLPVAAINHIPATRTTLITVPANAFVQGRDDYDAAEALYEARSQADAGKAVKRGFAGLKMIGKDE